MCDLIMLHAVSDHCLSFVFTLEFLGLHHRPMIDSFYPLNSYYFTGCERRFVSF